MQASIKMCFVARPWAGGVFELSVSKESGTCSVGIFDLTLPGVCSAGGIFSGGIY